ncbi:MAG: TrkH family potassium uptake protein [Tissierellia bacterium]|nr:TrkH family potassium uptake protein [Tissierellia bacterium]
MKIQIRKLLSSPPKTLALGFIFLILLGSLLLMLPIARYQTTDSTVIDAIFTSTSAVCVTGLIVENTATFWTPFGKGVILCLIQIGGIGFMTVASIFFLFTGRRITLTERVIIKEQFNTNQKSGIVRLTSVVLKYTFVIEAIGALLLSLVFIPKFGFSRGLAFSIFHSISAFCNAGFDILGNSLVDYTNEPIIIVTIGALVVLGGLGFAVIHDLFRRRNNIRIATHTKLVLVMTGTLILVGTLLFLAIEYDNSTTLKGLSFPSKVLNSIFQAIVPRTAGFQSVNFAFVRDSTLLVTILLMFIGASPGSTGGGIKTTTLGVIVATVISVVKGSNDIEMFKRRIDVRNVMKALTILSVGLLLVLVISFMLTLAQPDIRFIDLLFEVTSAFGTVGLSVGVTNKFHVFGKLMIIALMYMGRVGPLTVLYAIQKKQRHDNIRYAKDDIIVG